MRQRSTNSAPQRRLWSVPCWRGSEAPEPAGSSTALCLQRTTARRAAALGKVQLTYVEKCNSFLIKNGQGLFSREEPQLAAETSCATCKAVVGGAYRGAGAGRRSSRAAVREGDSGQGRWGLLGTRF
jgi:hypothetical protein